MRGPFSIIGSAAGGFSALILAVRTRGGGRCLRPASAAVSYNNSALVIHTAPVCIKRALGVGGVFLSWAPALHQFAVLPDGPGAGAMARVSSTT
jgi:hypothetical protein